MRSKCPIPIKDLYIEGIGKYQGGIGVLYIVPREDFFIQYRNYIFAYLLWKGRSKVLTDTIFKESDFEKHKKEEYWRFIYK